MLSTRAYAGGCVLLLICVAASLMLVLEHLTGMSLPGCGPGSGCAEAAASVWGTTPYVNWPVSYLGLAYFLGIMAVWLGSRGGVTVGMRYLLRAGALISIGFSIIMIVEGHVCQYCVTTHLCNLIFIGLVEFTKPAKTGTPKAFAIYAGMFVISSVVLGVTESHQSAAVGVKAEEKLADSTAQIIASSARDAETPEAATESGAEQLPEQAIVEEAPSKPFSGRYRLGPEQAAIRVVLVGDYQCQECRRIEKDVIRLFEQRDDMSVSFKHYPMSSDCNRMAKSRRHPNACWAARAAETAGILRGEEGYWEMHFWLYEQRGSFTNKTFPPKLRELGYDTDEFFRVMGSEKTLGNILDDVEEAVALGIWYTPSVFINGVELRGWEAPRAVERAINDLAATNPPPLTAAADQPPLAVEKLIGDWQARPLRTIPEGVPFRSMGPEDASARLVMFGDFQQSGAVDLDGYIRRIVAERGDVRYEYRHFPFDKGCNPSIKRETESATPCQTAVAAEAVGRVAGADAYWEMHAWLFENRENYSEEAFLAAAESAGIAVAELRAAMSSAETLQAIREDGLLGGRLNATKVPSLFLNGRLVPRWLREGESILPQIVDRAVGGE